MLYLKYRPKKISDLDSLSVKDRLSKILSSESIPHAFLLVGQKGMGKTSVARIIAKSVNCLDNLFSKKNDSFEPCQKCSNCLAIDLSDQSDVIEIDAASHRGIEDVKNLIKDISFLPMEAKYRVMIIDEAHMITNDAFNALLKTLEEPPSHVIFILATTNKEKVPTTIISRCVTITFEKANENEIISMLKKITHNEKYVCSDDFLSIISQNADSSFRDATKLLEECIMHGIKTKEEAEIFFKTQSKDTLFSLFEKKDIKEALVWLDTFVKKGGNIQILIESLLKLSHLALLEKTGASQQSIHSSLTIKQISLLMKLLNESYSLLRASPIPSIPLEIAIIEFYNENK